MHDMGGFESHECMLVITTFVACNKRPSFLVRKGGNLTRSRHCKIWSGGDREGQVLEAGRANVLTGTHIWGGAEIDLLAIAQVKKQNNPRLDGSEFVFGIDEQNIESAALSVSVYNWNGGSETLIGKVNQLKASPKVSLFVSCEPLPFSLCVCSV